MLSDGHHDIPLGKTAMIVTHLEMRAPVDIRPVPDHPGIDLRRVDVTVPWYRDVFRRVGTDWLWAARMKLSDEALEAIITDPKVEIYTLTKDGRDEALLELSFAKSGACELAYFGLTSALIGTGSGRRLMNHAITRAWSKPIERFHLHTCTLDSPQALPFYRRSGFVPVRQQVEICDDPRLIGFAPEDAGGHAPIFRP